jgi:cytosine/adenosine deaminase-related metal-dependent hydrolase
LDWRFDGLTALVSIAAGKAADLVVLAGNRAKNVDDVERVETVFKDGVGYDPAKLMRSVEGLMGSR